MSKCLLHSGHKLPEGHGHCLALLLVLLLLWSSSIRSELQQHKSSSVSLWGKRKMQYVPSLSKFQHGTILVHTHDCRLIPDLLHLFLFAVQPQQTLLPSSSHVSPANAQPISSNWNKLFPHLLFKAHPNTGIPRCTLESQCWRRTLNINKGKMLSNTVTC